ncbi:hypothetical protein Lser_V15G27643 [Lactuca serriola]
MCCGHSFDGYGGVTRHHGRLYENVRKNRNRGFYRLSRGVVETFGDVYLWKPSLHDLQELYAAHEERHGFPGMIGSIDCTHWKWKNCPVAWKGQYASDHHGSPSLVLEAVASQDLWIRHAFFGVAGSNNDVNVLDQLPIFDDLLNGKAPDAPFTVNGNEYKYEYYLTDEIYPRYSTFVKAFRHPVEERDKFFKRRQEGARNDVERAFGVLKAKWHIVEHATRPLDLETLRYIIINRSRRQDTILTKMDTKSNNNVQPLNAFIQ